MGVLYFDSLALQAMSRSLLSWQQQSASPVPQTKKQSQSVFKRPNFTSVAFELCCSQEFKGNYSRHSAKVFVSLKSDFH